MAIRVRKIENKNATGGFSYIALCAAETKPEPGDLYLDDSVHHALSGKFYDDHVKMGFIKKPTVTEEFVGMLRDRLMAIPIREYFIPNRRKVIADRIAKELIKNGVEVMEK